MTGDRAGTPPVIPLDDAAALDVRAAGRKAATLARLRQGGFPVPFGLVLPSGVHERARSGDPAVSGEGAALLRRAVAAIEAGLGTGAVAVRSSALAEDLPGRSHAGLYRTVLDVRGRTAIEAAVRACWASHGGARIYAAADNAAADNGAAAEAAAMAVLVQPMLDPACAGAAFATGGDDRGPVTVSAVRGIGAGLMSGTADADEWRVEAGSARCVRSAGDALDPAGALAVAALARGVAEALDGPVEIEWALVAGRVLLLQARPMTGLPPAHARWDAGPRGEWRRDIRLGEWLPEPVTPLFASWFLPVADRRFRATQHERSGVAVPRPAYVLRNGWYYHSSIGDRRSSVLFRGMVTRPGFAVGMLAGRRWPGLTRRLVGDREIDGYEHVRARQRAALGHADAHADSTDAAVLLDVVDRLVTVVADHVWCLVMIGGAAWRTEVALARYLDRALPAPLSTAQHGLLAAAGAGGAVPGHAVSTLDWYRPTLGELGGATPADPADRRRRAHEAADLERRCRTALAGRRGGDRRFGLLLGLAVDSATRRAACAEELTRPWPAMRRAIRRLGAGLHDRGVLDDPGDVFFLTVDELRAAAGSTTAPLHDVVRARRATWREQTRLRPPIAVGVPAMLLRFLLPPAARPAAADDGVLHGVGVSPGRATGRAHVVDHGAPLSREFAAGDILVVRAFVPTLAPLLARAAGVASDTGSVAAHTSVLSREFGVPGVVGLGSVTDVVRDGDVITVDGTRGLVDVRPTVVGSVS